MQAVILAAGRGTRMGALTNDLPKPLLQTRGKTLLEHKFDALPDIIDEVVLVVGYHGPKIKAQLGDTYNGRPITYVTQEVLNGTAGALWTAEPVLRDRFVIMMADDLYAHEDIERCATADGWVVMLSDTHGPGSGGKVLMEDGKVIAIEEATYEGHGLVNTNVFGLDTRIFDYPMVPKAPGSQEYGLPQTVLATSLLAGIPLDAFVTDKWEQITSPDDLTQE